MRTGRTRIIQYGIGILLTVIFFLSGFTRGFAEETSLQINVPVHVEFSRQGLSPEKIYHLTLTPEDTDAPMPEGAANGTYSLRISKADGKDYTIVIQYPKVGEYWYEVRIADSSDKALGTWELHVMSIVDENGKRQVTTTLRNGDKTGEKTDSIRVSDPDQPETVPQTPETSGIPEEPDGKVKGTSQDSDQGSEVVSGTGGGSQAGTTGQSNVLTGDATRTEFWLIMLSASGVTLVLVAVLLLKKRRKRSQGK